MFKSPRGLRATARRYLPPSHACQSTTSNVFGKPELNHYQDGGDNKVYDEILGEPRAKEVVQCT